MARTPDPAPTRAVSASLSSETAALNAASAQVVQMQPATKTRLAQLTASVASSCTSNNPSSSFNSSKTRTGRIQPSTWMIAG